MHVMSLDSSVELHMSFGHSHFVNHSTIGKIFAISPIRGVVAIQDNSQRSKYMVTWWSLTTYFTVGSVTFLSYWSTYFSGKITTFYSTEQYTPAYDQNWLPEDAVYKNKLFTKMCC